MVPLAGLLNKSQAISDTGVAQSRTQTCVPAPATDIPAHTGESPPRCPLCPEVTTGASHPTDPVILLCTCTCPSLRSLERPSSDLS